MNIQIRNLTKKFNGRAVFENFNLMIESGKVTCLMGKSGLGKTTLIRILIGLEKYDYGEIEGLGEKKIRAVFQEDRLCENLTPVTNVAMVCEKKITLEEIETELGKVGLSDSLYKQVKELSGGMKRRVAIVRSLMPSSDMIVMDEPFKGLDTETKKMVIDYLKGKIEGKTVVIVTHDIKEAEAFGGKIVKL